MGPQFGYAPVFTKMIQDCDTKEGRRAEFECRAYGMPEPTATWWVCMSELSPFNEAFGLTPC